MLRHFEVMVVVVLVAATAFAVLVAVNKLAFLNFFYIPVLVAAYFLGRRQGVLASVAAVLMVLLYATIDPAIFTEHAQQPMLNLALWALFTVLTAAVVGTLYEVKEGALRDLKQAYEGVLEILAKFIDSVDKHTKDHSVRVSGMAAQIAQHMGLDAAEVDNVRVAGLLHDVGKVEISIEVLRKASELNEDEWALIKSHPTKGTAMLRPIGGLLRDILPVVECHHESFDGSGYNGLKGDRIPLGARILAVADSYDAMVSDRPYRSGRTPQQAIAELEACRGTQFDPAVVDAFKAVMFSQLEYA